MPTDWAYFDTSILVKRYIGEAGSLRARSLLQEYRFLSSTLAPVELMAALCRRLASGELRRQDFATIRSRILKDRATWELVEVSPQVLAQAEDLVQQTVLKTLDAIHVASALAFQAVSGIRVPFVTGDAQQRRAAGRVEFDVVWVG